MGHVHLDPDQIITIKRFAINGVEITVIVVSADLTLGGGCHERFNKGLLHGPDLSVMHNGNPVTHIEQLCAWLWHRIGVLFLNQGTRGGAGTVIMDDFDDFKIRIEI